ncbi:MAG: PIG-L family deacetylase [Devosia indica]
MSVLVVIAHPDDEVLGAGGTCHSLARQGVEINLCVMSGSVDARKFRPELPDLHNDILAATLRIGIRDFVLGGFDNVKMNAVPHLDLVQFIEANILKYRPEYIFTHHPSDLNNDHQHTALACMAAARLFQRRSDVPRIRGLYAMEILSSTDWAFPGHSVPFQPTTFHEIGEEGVIAKIEALAAYRGVSRAYPHPRSPEALRGQAATRGAQAGLFYAEAFQLLMGDLPLGGRSS